MVTLQAFVRRPSFRVIRYCALRASVIIILSGSTGHRLVTLFSFEKLNNIILVKILHALHSNFSNKQKLANEQ